MTTTVEKQMAEISVEQYEYLLSLLRRSQDYLGRVADTHYPGSLNLWLEIKQVLKDTDAA